MIQQQEERIENKSNEKVRAFANALYEKDIKTTNVKKNETVAVLGYGLQGRAQASNLSDSGFKVTVGLRKDGASWNLAKKDGHKVMEVQDAAKEASIIHVLVPDMVQSDLYKKIEPYVTKGKALGFSHGAAIHWGWIKPPSNVDVFMIAPKAPGQRLREVYVQGFGTPSLVAVHQDATGHAWQRTLELAKGIGSARAGLIKTTFKEEVESDWFGEQVDLCGGVDRMIRNAFEVLTERGYQPEIAYFECLHELKLIVDLIQRYGITGMYRGVSETARYGGLVVGPTIMTEETKDRMRKALDKIQSGEFAEEWVASYQREGTQAFEKYLRELENHPIEQVGSKLRGMMWPEDSANGRSGKAISWSKLQSKNNALRKNTPAGRSTHSRSSQRGKRKK
jgi:ketol-acid reductoisomerase